VIALAIRFYASAARFSNICISPEKLVPESQPNDQLSVKSLWFRWLEELEGVAARHELKAIGTSPLYLRSGKRHGLTKSNRNVSFIAANSFERYQEI
jgi:hypothetical protein